MNNRFKLLCGIFICILLFSDFALAGDQREAPYRFDIIFLNNTEQIVYLYLYHSFDRSRFYLKKFPVPPRTAYSYRNIPIPKGAPSAWYHENGRLIIDVITARSQVSLFAQILIAFPLRTVKVGVYDDHSPPSFWISTTHHPYESVLEIAKEVSADLAELSRPHIEHWIEGHYKENRTD